MKTIEQCENDLRAAMNDVANFGLEATRNKLIAIMNVQLPASPWSDVLLADCHYAGAALNPLPPFGDGLYAADLFAAIGRCEAARINPATPQDLRQRACWCEAHALLLLGLVRHAQKPMSTVYPQCSIDDIYRDTLKNLLGEFDDSTFAKLLHQRVKQLFDEAPGPVTWLDFHKIVLDNAIERWDQTGVAWR